MDPDLSIFINLLWTVFVYGFLPVIFLAFRRNPVSLSNLKKLCVLFTSISFVLLSLIYLPSGNYPSLPPALFWGVVFYHILRSSLRNKGLLSDAAAPEPERPVVDISDIPCEVVEEYRSEYPSRFTILPPKPAEPAKEKRPMDSRRPPMWCIVLCVVLALTCAGSLLWAFSAEQRAAELETTLISSSETDDADNDALAYAEAERLFHYNRFTAFSDLAMVIVPEDDRYFHEYSCSAINGCSSFSVHDYNYCRSLGYSPCPDCIPDASLLDKTAAAFRYHAFRTQLIDTSGIIIIQESTGKVAASSPSLLDRYSSNEPVDASDLTNSSYMEAFEAAKWEAALDAAK